MHFDPRPTGMPWLMPYLTVTNVDQAIAFYQKAFNFILLSPATPGEDGVSIHAEMKYKDVILMFGKEGAHDNNSRSPKTNGIESPIGLYLYCDQVDHFFIRAVNAGATALLEPTNMFWGDRMCRLGDDEGYIWAFGTKIV